MSEVYKNKSLENLPEEEWRPIPGYENLFMASNIGRIKKLQHFGVNRWKAPFIKKEKILTQTISDKGYARLDLCPTHTKKSMTAHRCVMLAFKGPPPEGMDQINHINGNKKDNRLENLEWSNNALNITHAWATGLFNPQQLRGADDKNSTLIMHSEYGTFYSIKELAKIENISRKSISQMVQNKIPNRTKYIAA